MSHIKIVASLIVNEIRMGESDEAIIKTVKSALENIENAASISEEWISEQIQSVRSNWKEIYQNVR